MDSKRFGKTKSQTGLKPNQTHPEKQGNKLEKYIDSKSERDKIIPCTIRYAQLGREQPTKFLHTNQLILKLPKNNTNHAKLIHHLR
jgi:hypothetical protein